jgi:hypothetical protein
MRTPALVFALTAAPALLAGQALPMVRPQASDSGRVVLETRLGGDSSQATRVDLRRGATYRVYVRPARGEIVVRKMTQDTGAASRAPLDTTTVPPDDSTRESRSFNVVARLNGGHLVELTNPRIGTTSVRITLLRRAAGDTLPTTARRRLIYNENVSAGPAIVELDSGRVYRIVHGLNVYIAPRSGYRPPVRLAPLTRSAFGGIAGVPFIPEFSGEYRLTVDPGDDASIQIYEEEADAAEIECIRNPNGPGCRGQGGVSKTGLLLAMLSIPIVAYVFFVK